MSWPSAKVGDELVVHDADEAVVEEAAGATGQTADEHLLQAVTLARGEGEGGADGQARGAGGVGEEQGPDHAAAAGLGPDADLLPDAVGGGVAGRRGEEGHEMVEMDQQMSETVGSYLAR